MASLAGNDLSKNARQEDELCLDKNMEVSIVIPLYNEEAIIDLMAERLLKVLLS